MRRFDAMLMSRMTASTFVTDTAGGEVAHGGRLAEARLMFPQAPEPFIDLSTGINPVPYPVPELSPETWSRLPEPSDVLALEEVAAAAYGAGTEQVVAAPGTQILISMLPFVFPLKSVAVVGPTYIEHAVAWGQAGAEVVEVGSIEEVGSVDVAGGYDGVVLCNPNNPDGRRTDPAVLEALAADLAARKGLLVVDEAFADPEEGPLSLIPTLPDEGAVVLRSFGKTYGLAGLRLGFAVAGYDSATRIRSALGPWAVSGPAVEIGRLALTDSEWRNRTLSRLAADVNRLDALLTRGGLEVVGGTPLFRLAESNAAHVIFDRLGQAGIFVRRFADRPSLLRFGMPGAEAEWERLAAALE
jgi:cobalamin biosynthetic protein CobC